MILPLDLSMIFVSLAPFQQYHSLITVPSNHFSISIYPDHSVTLSVQYQKDLLKKLLLNNIFLWSKNPRKLSLISLLICFYQRGHI